MAEAALEPVEARSKETKDTTQMVHSSSIRSTVSENTTQMVHSSSIRSSRSTVSENTTQMVHSSSIFRLWSSGRTAGVCFLGEEQQFEIGDFLLDRDEFQSVRKAVKHLNETGCNEKYKIVFSATIRKYFVLFRRNFQEEAFEKFGVPLTWDEGSYFELNDETSDSTISGKAILLDKKRFTTVADALRVLNYPYDNTGSEIYSHIKEFCVVFDKATNKYIVLYNSLSSTAKGDAMNRFTNSFNQSGAWRPSFLSSQNGAWRPSFLSSLSNLFYKTSQDNPLNLVTANNRILTDKYEICQILGSGVQGITRLVKRRNSDELFVAKESNETGGKVGRKSAWDGFKAVREKAGELEQEFEWMRNLRHPNCIKVVEFIKDEKNLQMFIITELAKGGDLYSYFNTMRIELGCASEDFFAKVFKQAMEGVAHLHATGIIHNDLKPENLLVMNKFDEEEVAEGVVPRVVVADYGCATSQSGQKIILGDPRYLSPEAMENFVKRQGAPKIGPKTDVWSMGVTIYQILSEDCIPFLYERCHLQDNAFVDAFRKLEKELSDMDVEVQFPGWKFSEDSKELLVNMLTKNVNDRPTAKETLECEWFQDCHNKRLALPELCHVMFSVVQSRPRQILRNAVAAKLEYEHVRDCHEIFNDFDPDRSGHIDRAEFKAAWREIGREGADVFFGLADLDSNGYLEFNEFVALCLDWAELDSNIVGRHLEMLCEDLIDGDITGDIELKKFQKTFEYTFGTCEDWGRALLEMDSDRNGKISIDELTRFVRGPDLSDSVASWDVASWDLASFSRKLHAE